MKTAIITLIGPANYVLGKYRFERNLPKRTSDKTVIDYLRYNPNFSVIAVAEESVEPKKPKATKPSKPAKFRNEPSAKVYKPVAKDVMEMPDASDSKKSRGVEA